MTTPDPLPSPSEPDELAHLDDAVIGQAFRWSFLAFITLLVAGGGLYLALKPRARTPETRLTQLSAPTVPQKPVAEVPAAKSTDITRAAGISFVHQNGAYGDKLLPETMGGGVAFFDFDNDAAPDLLFINSTTWPWTRGVAGAAPAPLPQMALYHNDGHGLFTDVTAGSGLDVSLSGMGGAVGDYDNDGRVDVFITAVGGNRLFHNEGGGRFRDVTAEAGGGGTTNDRSPNAAWIDYDNDGRLDLFVGHYIRWSREIELGIAIGNFANEMTALYVAQNMPTNFADQAITEGVGPDSRLLLKFGVFFFDYDLDGWLDSLSANGHLGDEIAKIQKSRTYVQPAQLFWNAGADQSGFLVVPSHKVGGDLFKPIVGRGSAYADIDGDGDLDVILTQIGGAPLLLRNDQALGHHWLRVKLIAEKSNRDAIGAWVTLRAGGVTQTRHVMPTRSYLSQSELPVTFGLGRVERVDSLEVTWPGGAKQALEPPLLDRLLVFEQRDEKPDRSI